MASINIILIDTDGPPPQRGGCQVNADGDTVTGLVTRVNFWNTTIIQQAFSIEFTKNNQTHTETVTIPPGTGSPQAPSSVTPPFTPGNWTPTISQNPNNGFWFVSNATISIASQSPAR